MAMTFRDLAESPSAKGGYGRCQDCRYWAKKAGRMGCVQPHFPRVHPADVPPTPAEFGCSLFEPKR